MINANLRDEINRAEVVVQGRDDSYVVVKHRHASVSSATRPVIDQAEVDRLKQKYRVLVLPPESRLP